MVCTKTSQAPIVDLRFKIAAFISFFGLKPIMTRLESGMFFSFHPSKGLPITFNSELFENILWLR